MLVKPSVYSFWFRMLHRSAPALQGGGEWGSGSGHGGGTGGSVRDAGGSFGKMEAAREEEYFRRLQKTQLTSLKKDVQHEVEHHEAEIRRHKETIDRLKKRQADLESELK